MQTTLLVFQFGIAIRPKMAQPQSDIIIKQEEDSNDNGEEQQEQEQEQKPNLVLGVSRPDVLLLVDRQNIAARHGGGLAILQKESSDQLWPAAFTRRFLRYRYQLREHQNDGEDEPGEKEENEENEIMFRTELPREESSLEATPLPPGLYSAGAGSTRLSIPRAVSYNLAATLSEQVEGLGEITQFLVLATPNSDEERRHALLSPLRGRTGLLTFAPPPADIYLDGALRPLGTEFIWFRGRAPRADALVGNVRANPDRPVLAPGTYTLWAMQYAHNNKHYQDDTGAPLVRWRLVQVMQATGFDLTEEISEDDVVVTQEHVLTEGETFVLPNSLVTGMPFSRWRYRPLDGDIWRPLPENMRRRKGDPAMAAEDDPRGEYALQGVYRAIEPLIQERILLLIHAAELSGRLNPAANLMETLDEEQEVDTRGVKLVLRGLKEMERAVTKHLSERARLLNEQAPGLSLILLSTDDGVAFASETAILLQYRWLIGYYTDLFRQAGPEVLSTSNIENITTLLVAIYETLQTISDPNALQPLSTLSQMEPPMLLSLAEKAAVYAPAFLPAAMALLNDLPMDPAAVLSALNEQRDIVLALELAVGDAVVAAHPTESNVVAVQERLDAYLRDRKPEIYQQPPIVQEKAQEMARMQENLERRQDLQGGGALVVPSDLEGRRRRRDDETTIVSARVPKERAEEAREALSRYAWQDGGGGTGTTGGNLVRVLPTQARIGAPLLQLGEPSAAAAQSDGGFIAPWQQLHALLFLRWSVLAPGTSFPEPLATVSFYAHQVRAAVQGRDVNTGLLYDVAHPQWGQSMWWASVQEDDEEEEDYEKAGSKGTNMADQVARRVVKLYTESPSMRTSLPFHDVLERARREASSGSPIDIALQRALLSLRQLSVVLQGYIVADGGHVKRPVRGLISHAARLEDLPLADIERVARAYEVVDLLPDLSTLANYTTDPGSSTDHLAPHGPMHPMEQLGGRTGVWVGMPSSWRAGPQVHDVLEQVIERLEALKLEQAAIRRDGSLSREEKDDALDKVAASLANEPFRWSSLYVPLEAEMLTAMHHADIAILQPGPPAMGPVDGSKLLEFTEAGVVAASHVITA